MRRPETAAEALELRIGHWSSPKRDLSVVVLAGYEDRASVNKRVHEKSWQFPVRVGRSQRKRRPSGEEGETLTSSRLVTLTEEDERP